MDLFDAAKNVAADAGRAVLEAGDGLERAGEHAFHGVVDGLKTQTKALSDAATSIASGIQNAHHDAAASLQHHDLLGAIEHAGHDISASGGEALSQMWGGMAGGAGQEAAGLHRSVLDVGGAVGHVFGEGAEAAKDITSAVAGKRAGEAMGHAVRQAGGAVGAVARAGFSGVTAASKVAGGMVRGTGDLVIGGVRMGTDADYRDKLVARAKDVALAIGDKELAAMRDPESAKKQLVAWVKGEVTGFTDEALSAQAKGELPEFVGDKAGAAFAQLASFAVPVGKGEQAAHAFGGIATEVGEAEGAVGTAGVRADAAIAGGDRTVRATGEAGDAVKASPTGTIEGRRYAQDAPSGKGRKGVNTGSGPGTVPSRPPAETTTPAPSDPEGEQPVPPRSEDGAVGPERSQAKPRSGAAGAEAARIDRASRRVAASMTRVGENGSAKAADLKLVLDHIGRYVPAPVMEALRDGGVKLIVGRNDVTDHFTELKGKISDMRGGGKTWDSVGGVYEPTTRVTVVSTELDPTTKLPRLMDVQGSKSVDLILHEVGHAVDHNLLGGTIDRPLSGEDVFTWACHLDRSVIGKSFPHPGTPSEAFAEGWARYRLNPGALEAETPHLYGYFENLEKAGGNPITWESMAAHMPRGAQWRKPPGMP